MQSIWQQTAAGPRASLVHLGNIFLLILCSLNAKAMTRPAHLPVLITSPIILQGSPPKPSAASAVQAVNSEAQGGGNDAATSPNTAEENAGAAPSSEQAAAAGPATAEEGPKTKGAPQPSATTSTAEGPKLGQSGAPTFASLAAGTAPFAAVTSSKAFGFGSVANGSGSTADNAQKGRTSLPTTSVKDPQGS